MNKEIRDRVLTLSTAAFGLVAALAWNDAIKALFAEFLGAQEGILALFIYAIAVTILTVIITMQIAKLGSDETKKV